LSSGAATTGSGSSRAHAVLAEGVGVLAAALIHHWQQQQQQQQQ
jgi:hypothetical protein